jgi:hypothetical protein
MRLLILHSSCAALIFFVACKESDTSDRGSPNPDSVSAKTEYQDGAYFWKPSQITMTLRGADESASGQSILLENDLGRNQYGWTMSVLDLPGSWMINNLRFEGIAIRFENDLGESFRVQPPELNDLDFDILDGGDKTERELEELWRQYGLLKKTGTEQGADDQAAAAVE